MVPIISTLKDPNASQSTFCKYNQPKFQKRKPLKFGQSPQSFARTVSIQEVHEDSDDDNEDDIPSLAACAPKFNEGECEQWVEEMKALGINF